MHRGCRSRAALWASDSLHLSVRTHRKAQTYIKGISRLSAGHINHQPFSHTYPFHLNTVSPLCRSPAGKEPALFLVLIKAHYIHINIIILVSRRTKQSRDGLKPASPGTVKPPPEDRLGSSPPLDSCFTCQM